MISKWEMTQVTENHRCNQCLINSLCLISFCVLWDDDVVLSASSGDLFYYSYPPVCGQISRHKAAAKHHSDFEHSVSEQTRDFRHWLLLLLFSQWSYWNHQIPRDDLMMYFCYQWSNVFTNDSFCWWPPRFNCWQKIARCRLPWSDDAIVGDQGMMRVMRCYLRGHLYYMPRIRSDHTRPEYIITCTYCQATDQANEIRNSIFLEHQKHILCTYMYVYKISLF